jgi:soluble lytic murein transglycosylase-like protein
MNVQLSLFDANRSPHEDEEDEGRRDCSTAPGRRQGRRRRLRYFVLTSLGVAVLHQPAQAPLNPPSNAHISSTIDSVMVIAPEQAYDGAIREAAAVYGIDAALIRSVMQIESGFDPWAVSRAGAMGLMQLTPVVVRAFRVDHPFDPHENILAGARLLRELLDRHNGNVKLAVASYNAGPTAVSTYGGIPPFGETRVFVKKVTGLIADARRAANDD